MLLVLILCIIVSLLSITNDQSITLNTVGAFVMLLAFLNASTTQRCLAQL